MFLDRFRSDNSKIEFSVIWSNWASTIDEAIAIKTKAYNTYFLAWVRKNLTYNWFNRAKDIDIFEKNYIIIDIDLRKQFKEYNWLDCSDEEIINTWLDMWKYLIDEHEYLWDYDFIVFSWNWLHFYYLWEYKNISPDDYAYWVQRIMNEWDSFWGFRVFNSDHACKNIARIIRLPWSINQKTWKECIVIEERQWKWKLLSVLESLAFSEKELELEKRKKETDRKIEEYKKNEKMNKLINWDRYEESKEKLIRIFEVIDSIPAYLIAEKILPQFPFNKNWKNFDNEKWWFCWYYYVSELNSICNWWSRYFLYDWDVNSCWSPSSLIKHEFNLTWWETIKYFKDNFNLKIN